MRIILNGRKVDNEDIAGYFQNKAYFTKRGLTRRTVLYELFHHLVCVSSLNMPEKKRRRMLTTLRGIAELAPCEPNIG